MTLIGRKADSRPILRMARSVVHEIEQTVGALPAEQGGPLGGSRSEGVIRHFAFDRSACRSGVTYSPDHIQLNRLFDEEWNPAGINLMGFVHSHPAGCRRPSAGDLVYATRILEAIPKLDRLFLPIVMTHPDTGRFELLPFVAERKGAEVQLIPAVLDIVADVEADRPAANQEDPMAERKSQERNERVASSETTETHRTGVPGLRWEIGSGETFRRVRGAYDLERLSRCRVIAVGAGGAASFLEELARCGVGEFVLVDPDTVSETNLATQQVYRRDLGRPKVDCIAERILDINPGARVLRCAEPLDAFSDGDCRALAFAGFDAGEVPEVSLLCGLTDNFEAQARINRLGLKLELPTLCAQVYREGRAAEITFTHPDTTPACHRCILSSRYAAYLNAGFRNDVTSDGTPIFSTTRLNALKGFVALALLHFGTQHPRLGGLLERIGKRNLIQIRMDPDIGESLGLKVFDRVLDGADGARLLFDDVVWLPQEPDRLDLNGRPTCPECGGGGSLRGLGERHSDTRVMPEGH